MHKRLFIRLLPSLIVALGLLVSSAGAQGYYQNSLTLSLGAYAASRFGTNPYVGVRYNYILPDERFFVEGSLGFSSLKSDVLETISRSQVFASDDLYTYEFVFAYDAVPTGYVPYVLGGVAGINQGGQTSFAGVLGLGKRMPLANFLGSDQLALRYDIRDQVFSQRINNAEPFLAHNITFTLGLQLFF
jgi:hypothetical protein